MTMTTSNKTTLFDTAVSSYSNTNVAAPTSTVLEAWNNYLRLISSTIASVSNGTLKESYASPDKSSVQLVTSTGSWVMSGVSVSGTILTASNLLVQNSSKTVSIEVQGQITVDTQTLSVSGEYAKLVYSNTASSTNPFSYTFKGKVTEASGFVSGTASTVEYNGTATSGIATTTTYGLTDSIVGWDYVNNAFVLSPNTKVANYTSIGKFAINNAPASSLVLEGNPVVSANTPNVIWGMMAGNDTIILSGNGDGMAPSGFAGNDLIIGDAGDNYFNNRVEALSNEFSGKGNDTIDGGAGYDTVFMGSNKKLSDYSLTQFDPSANSIVFIDNSATDNTGTDKFTNIEEIRFAEVNLKFSQLKTFLFAVDGASGGMLKYGASTAETITGTARNDAINALGGNDIINAGDGNDLIYGGSGNDTADGGTGVDTFGLEGKAANYTLTLSADGITVTDKLGVEGTDKLKNFEKLSFSDKTVMVESQPHGSYADLPVGLYQFFITAFNAAPGVTYMGQLAAAYRAGMSVKQIVDIFTTKSQFTDVYPTSLGHGQLAQALVNNIVKTSASDATKQQAVKDITAAMDTSNWTVGQVIYQVFGNLANFAYSDPTWGNTAKQFANEIALAKTYTDTLSQSTTDLATLRSVMTPVSHLSDVSTPELQISLIGQALMSWP
jgi:Ca2+-binding RTX toxin-like protein